MLCDRYQRANRSLDWTRDYSQAKAHQTFTTNLEIIPSSANKSELQKKNVCLSISDSQCTLNV